MPKKKKQLVVIGLGRFGRAIATTLYSMGYDVLAIDSNADLVENIADSVTHAVCLDATDEDAFRALGIRNFDVAIVSIGENLQASILVTMLCKEEGIAYVLAKAASELHAKVLSRIGADKVVLPERDMGARVARSLVSSNILEYIELSDEYSLAELEVPAAWAGKSLQQLNLRVRYGVNVVAIRHCDGAITVSPMGSDMLSAGDLLIAMGAARKMERLAEHTERG